MPIFNIFLLWLRRDDLLGDPPSPTILDLKESHLDITQGQESLELPLKQIKSIQRRSQGAWLLTESDHLISVPRQGLLEGDYDAFMTTLEQAMAYDEAKG